MRKWCGLPSWAGESIPHTRSDYIPPVPGCTAADNVVRGTEWDRSVTDNEVYVVLCVEILGLCLHTIGLTPRQPVVLH